MSAHRESCDVVVIGGGLIGCSIAWQLALRGLRVRVVERDTPARSASWAAAGMLSPVGEHGHVDQLRRLADASLDLYADFIDAVQDATGIDPQYRRSGKLHVALTESDLESIRSAFGPDDAQALSADEVRKLEPGVTASAAGGFLVERDHHVDNRLLGRAVWIAAAGAGATFDNGTAVVAIEREGNRVTGVRFATGELVDADFVIVAAGAWSGNIAGISPLPVVPVRGQMCAFESVPPPLNRVVATSSVYVIPRANGRTLVGATLEHAGFRNECTGGGIRMLLDAAIEAVPALANAALAEMWSGLRPGTVDGLPIIGPDPDAAGLIHATGHYRNGILLAPITAEIVSTLVIGQTPRIDIRPYQVERFRDRADAARAPAVTS